MKVTPLTLRQANEYIEKNHRHHKPVQGHRFSIGAVDNAGSILGVAVVGRPVARMVNAYDVAEVTRLCTAGEKNVCSFLYSACARICREMGFKKIQTYILETETGGSLAASGWTYEGPAGGGQWKHTDGKKRRDDQPIDKKSRWAKELNQ